MSQSGAPILWLAAPAGSGKTLGVARYLAKRGSTIWYEVDDEDRDPGTFVAGLGLALSDNDPSRVPPQLAPIPEPVLQAEATRLFGLLLGMRQAPFCLVLDNLQQADDSPGFVAVLSGLLHAFVRHAPTDSKVIVTSRHGPPRELSRLVVEGAIEVLDSDVLRLDRGEAEALIATLSPSKLASSEQSTDDLLTRSGGWCVAAALLAREGASLTGRPSEATAEAFGHYLSSEVFEGLPHKVRRALELLSFFSRASGRCLASMHSEVEFEELARRVAAAGIPHTVEEDGSLRLHDLVRETLRAEFLLRASKSTDHADVRRLVRALADDGQIQEATQLGAEFACYDELALLAKQHAGALMSTGRIASVDAILSQLPAARVEGDPELLFWQASCNMARKPDEAERGFKRAFERFESDGNVVFATLSAACIVQAIVIRGDDFRAAGEWAERLEREPIGALPLSVQASARTAVLLTHYLAARGTRAAARAAEQALALVGKSMPPLEVMNIAGTAIVVYHFAGRSADADAAFRVARAAAESAPYDHLSQVSFGYHRTMHHFLGNGSAEASVESAERELQGAPYPIPQWTSAMAVLGLMAAAALGEIDRAAAFLPVLERDAQTGSLMARGQVAFARGLLEFARGDFAKALESTSLGRALSMECGVALGQVPTILTEVMVLGSMGRFEEARASLAEIETMLVKAESGYFCVDALLIRAFLDLEENGLLAARPTLARAMSAARAIGRYPAGALSRSVLRRVVAAALELDVEPDLARGMARWAKLDPPLDDFRPAWPWPVVLRTLGTFRVESAGTPDDAGSGDGPQQRLLKLLVAARGEPVSVVRLATELWPSREPAASRSAFHTALHRLRRYLGDESLVLLEGGEVRLDRRRIWTDAWALDTLTAIVEAQAADAPLDQLERWATHLLALYRGSFSRGDPQSSLVRADARLSRAFAATVERLVGGLRRHGRLERACWLVDAALEREESSESLHGTAIALFFERDLPSEAEQAYERCRGALRTLRRSEPPPSIEQLVNAGRRRVPTAG